jgi:hypothetical protein
VILPEWLPDCSHYSEYTNNRICGACDRRLRRKYPLPTAPSLSTPDIASTPTTSAEPTRSAFTSPRLRASRREQRLFALSASPTLRSRHRAGSLVLPDRSESAQFALAEALAASPQSLGVLYEGPLVQQLLRLRSTRILHNA